MKLPVIPHIPTTMHKLLVPLMFAAMFSVVSHVRAQSPPDSLCAVILPDGTVEVNWNIPVDMQPGYTFRIFRNLGAGFVSIADLPPTQNTFIDANVDATTQVVKYFIRVIGGSEQVTSQTISTLLLQLNSTNLGSVANLSWNLPLDPPPPGSTFLLDRRILPGGYQLLAQLPANATQYKDTIYGQCGESVDIEYRIRFDSGYCQTGSRPVSGEFQDLLGPPIPEVETILTDPVAGDVTIFWHPVSSPDLAKYVIQNIDLQAQTYVDVGEVLAGEPTQFTYTDAVDNGSTTFGVRAEDNCGNEQNFNFTHTTMYAQVYHTECELSALVAWSPYEGWPEGVDRYVIYAMIDGQPPVEMGSADSDEVFFEAPVQPNREYCFFVEARSLGDQRPSTSNGACVVPNYPPVPEHFAIDYVSAGQGAIEVAVSHDPGGEGASYELFRSAGDGPFRSLGKLAGENAPVITYLDTDVSPADQVYTYYIQVIDGCGNVLGETNRARNIVLEAVADSSSVSNRLNWSEYGEWDGGVAHYEVLRSFNTEENQSVFATLDPDVFQFIEDVEAFRTNAGRFCYRIQAVEGGPNGSKALSNVVCISQPPAVWIPNSIVLGGFNDVFKPVAGFIDFSSFRMEIYGKWGERIFETDRIDEGWNGTYKGDFVPAGYYRYVIFYRDGSGKPYTAQDVVFVLKN